MKVHIIYTHPSKKSLTHKIKESYIKGLEQSNIKYTISDLYEDNFNPDMTEEEYLRESNYTLEPIKDKTILKEQEQINNADILTFIFPLFWMDAPAKLVGWFTRVFTHGFRYHIEENKETMKTINKVNFLIITGSNYEDLKADGKIDALETIFKTDRINNKAKKTEFTYFSSASHDKLDKTRENKYIKQAYELGIKTSIKN
ncbi:NAD(P)H-dependent oxidoreductase [Methanosphaera sp. WGK6]|uniref:NAD(P)H-dependent oxidoreductase n=1 Tax=Methanosphaera sp. WGK6 TaxID=1561964 RepID=UPI00084C5CCF|nr:NAD(P)H-dependent oxidoreductase [Methanosphaera sp. WGK6]